MLVGKKYINLVCHLLSPSTNDQIRFALPIYVHTSVDERGELDHDIEDFRKDVKSNVQNDKPLAGLVFGL